MEKWKLLVRSKVTGEVFDSGEFTGTWVEVESMTNRLRVMHKNKPFEYGYKRVEEKEKM